MNNQFARRRLLASTIISGTLAAAAAISPTFAMAQDGEAAEVDTIIVTGSRIARRDAVAESPILTVAQQDITHSGSTTVEHYLNTLPQITPGISSQSNNPSSNGRAFIDLRGLGSHRNLVLIDGRRPMASTGGGTVDVNTIPAALIERVEIITGGAASTYGADAVSGVVNFILRNDFEGVEVDSQYRLTEEGDGEEWGFGITLGGRFADGRGGAVFNASYFSREAMYKGARDFSAQASGTTGIFPGGSATFPGNFPSAAAINAIFPGGACTPISAGNPVVTGGAAGFGFNPDGSLFCTGIGGGNPFDVVGYTGPDEHIATAFFPDVFSYNFEPDNILVLPLERWNLFSRVNYEINDNFKPYAQAVYTNYNALQELAPTPGGGFTVPVTNPFVQSNPQLLALLNSRADPAADFTFAKRFNQVGGRTGYNNHDVWQVVVGTTGDLFDIPTWTYDVYASYGRSVQTEIQGGNIRFPQFNAVLADPVTAGSGACASWDPFGLNSPMSQACSDFISLQAKNLTVIDQSVVEGTMTGSLFELPAGTVQLALGASYRELDFDFLPDSGLVPGQVVGFNAALPVSGALNWTDLFAEIYVPILTDLPFVQNLSVTGGYRTTSQNQSGSADSWKITGDWTVNDWLRFRGGLQTATRSPSVGELFQPQVPSFPAITGSDPCNTTGGSPTARTGSYHDEFGRNGANGANVQALCAAQAGVAGQSSYFQAASQAESVVGGNPDLTPETAESYTVGLVLRAPTSLFFFNNVYFSADYWNIQVEDAISSFGAVTIIQRCFNRDGANPTYSAANPWCQLFGRAPGDGRILGLTLLQDNRNYVETSGVDFALGWGFDLGGAGSLDFSVVSTWVESFGSGTAVTATDPVYEYVGTIGSGTGSAVPEWRHVITAGWNWDDISITAVGRYTDSMDHNLPVTGGVGTGTESVWYADLRATYDLTDNLSLRVGVNNLFDKSPQLYSPNVQANTDPSTYDVLGRRYFVGLTARF